MNVCSPLPPSEEEGGLRGCMAIAKKVGCGRKFQILPHMNKNLGGEKKKDEYKKKKRTRDNTGDDNGCVDILRDRTFNNGRRCGT